MRTTSLFVITSALLTASTAMAQPIGIFRWQTQPSCNILNIHVTQQAGVYSLDGIDDRCGGAEASASVVGVASSTAGGSTRLGLTIVMPGATPIHIEATIDVSLNGAWRDSAGNSGPFVLTPNARAPGAPRPVPSAGLAPASVTSAKIATAAVGPWHIAEQSVSGAHIVDGSLKSEELFDPPQTIGTVGEYPSHLESGASTFSLDRPRCAGGRSRGLECQRKFFVFGTAESRVGALLDQPRSPVRIHRRPRDRGCGKKNRRDGPRFVFPHAQLFSDARSGPIRTLLPGQRVGDLEPRGADRCLRPRFLAL